MKPFDYLYFNIYNHFYQRLDKASEFYARIQAMYLFALSAGGWVLFLEATYLRLVRHSWFSTKQGATFFALTIYALSAIISHYIFIIQERDRKIFGKYEESWDSNPYKQRDLVISVVVMVIPYLLLLTLRIFFPRPS